MAEPPPANQPYVFLSYTTPDRTRVLALADTLEAAGIRVWVDRRDIAGGSSWDTSIVHAISHCTVFALTCSAASLASPNVQQEVRLAWEERRPVLPLLLEAVTIPADLRYPLAGRQWVELLDRPEAAWLPEVLRALAGFDLMPAPRARAADATAPPVAVSPPTNLPAPLTSFLGREQELTDLAELLANNRMVTLTGPGGTGKTRLALRVAAAQTAAFPDGVYFIDLSPLADPDLVPSAVAQVLAVPERADLPVQESISRVLRDKHLLLVLDNYEHLLPAAAFVGALLQTVPALKVLTTSRAPLRIPGEWEYPVAPLPLPDERQTQLAEVSENPTVALFVVRAQAVRPDFVLNDGNAAAVAAICARLDGLPLAIELAAARVRVLTPLALLARLTLRLPLLTGGGRTAPARQQTLRGAIAWSYALLEPAEQTLFRRLAVFAGGCTLDLAEAVSNADEDLGLDILDGISSLVEKSLLRETAGTNGEPRYRMLETIREFALGELDASGEAETVRRQLAVQVLQLARQYAAANNWARLDVELDNGRSVLGWCVERAELAVGVRLLWALHGYFPNRGHGNELGEWRHRLLALTDAAFPNISRARLLAMLPFALLSISDQERETAELEEAAALSRALGDAPALAEALGHLALLRLNQGKYDAMVPLAEEVLPLFLAAGDAVRSANVQAFLIIAALARGDGATAERLLAANRAIETTTRSAGGLVCEARLAETHGDDAGARAFLEEALRKSGASEGAQSPARLAQLTILAGLMMRQGDTQAAVATCAANLAVQRSVGPATSLAAVLVVLVQAAERCGLSVICARLLATVDMLMRHFAVEAPGLKVQQQAATARVRAALDEATFAEEWAAGEAQSADAAIEFGLAVAAQLQQTLARAADRSAE